MLRSICILEQAETVQFWCKVCVCSMGIKLPMKKIHVIGSSHLIEIPHKVALLQTTTEVKSVLRSVSAGSPQHDKRHDDGERDGP